MGANSVPTFVSCPLRTRGNRTRPGNRARHASLGRTTNIPGPRRRVCSFLPSVDERRARSAWDATDRKIGSIGLGVLFNCVRDTKNEDGGRSRSPCCPFPLRSLSSSSSGPLLLVLPVLPRIATTRSSAETLNASHSPRSRIVVVFGCRGIARRFQWRRYTIFSVYNYTALRAARRPSNFLAGAIQLRSLNGSGGRRFILPRARRCS